MSSTAFTNGSTLTDASWFNDTNAVVYSVLGDGATPPATAIAATKNLFKQGTNIASATTTNLANATGNYVHITGVTTITSFGTVNAGVPFILVFDGALILTQNATSLILPGAANITTVAGDVAIMVSEGSGNWRCIAYKRAATSPGINKQPTRQILTASSGTYTTPTISPCTRLYVRASAAGAGGEGGGGVGQNFGGNGGNTTFGTLTCNGGVGTGAGGTASGGDLNMTGSAGGAGAPAANGNGGNGGNSPLGMSGNGGSGNGGGFGGAGAGGNSGSGNTNAGSGGGGGGYLEKIIISPASTYSYTVGSGGTSGPAGSGSSVGGTGAPGGIIVDEYYD